MNEVEIASPSLLAVLLTLHVPNQISLDGDLLKISTATGILVAQDYPKKRVWLVTAGHVLSGRRADNGELCSKLGVVPTVVRLRCFTGVVDGWTNVDVPLYGDDAEPLWWHHPRGREVDIAVLELPRGLGQHPTVSPVDLAPLDAPIHLSVGDDLRVVGYPFGAVGGAGLAIWTRAMIATDMQFEYDGLPVFLVDARTRRGQSGAPVFFYSPSGMVPTKGGVAGGLGSNVTRLLGIYSGRIHDDSDVGRVVRTSAVLETFTHIWMQNGDLPTTSLEGIVSTLISRLAATGEPDGPSKA